jgi:hypothetical protein
MKVSEFNALSRNKKADILWVCGVHIDSIGKPNLIFGLYSLFDFFVEIELVDYDITEIRAFKNSSAIDKYLEKIDISNLFVI